MRAVTHTGPRGGACGLLLWWCSCSVRRCGAILASGVVPGGMGNTSTNALSFGHPWGGTNYDGAVTALEITANADDFDAEAPPPEPPAEEPPADRPPRTPDDAGNNALIKKIMLFLGFDLYVRTANAAQDDARDAPSATDKMAFDHSHHGEHDGFST